MVLGGVILFFLNKADKTPEGPRSPPITRVKKSKTYTPSILQPNAQFVREIATPPLQAEKFDSSQYNAKSADLRNWAADRGPNPLRKQQVLRDYVYPALGIPEGVLEEGQMQLLAEDDGSALKDGRVTAQVSFPGLLGRVELSFEAETGGQLEWNGSTVTREQVATLLSLSLAAARQNPGRRVVEIAWGNNTGYIKLDHSEVWVQEVGRDVQVYSDAQPSRPLELLAVPSRSEQRANVDMVFKLANGWANARNREALVASILQKSHLIPGLAQMIENAAFNQDAKSLRLDRINPKKITYPDARVALIDILFAAAEMALNNNDKANYELIINALASYTDPSILSTLSPTNQKSVSRPEVRRALIDGLGYLDELDRNENNWQGFLTGLELDAAYNLIHRIGTMAGEGASTPDFDLASEVVEENIGLAVFLARRLLTGEQSPPLRMLDPKGLIFKEGAVAVLKRAKTGDEKSLKALDAILYSTLSDQNQQGLKLRAIDALKALPPTKQIVDMLKNFEMSAGAAEYDADDPWKGKISNLLLRDYVSLVLRDMKTSNETPVEVREYISTTDDATDPGREGEGFKLNIGRAESRLVNIGLPEDVRLPLSFVLEWAIRETITNGLLATPDGKKVIVSARYDAIPVAEGEEPKGVFKFRIQDAGNGFDILTLQIVSRFNRFFLAGPDAGAELVEDVKEAYLAFLAQRKAKGDRVQNAFLFEEDEGLSVDHLSPALLEGSGVSYEDFESGALTVDDLEPAQRAYLTERVRNSVSRRIEKSIAAIRLNIEERLDVMQLTDPVLYEAFKKEFDALSQEATFETLIRTVSLQQRVYIQDPEEVKNSREIVGDFIEEGSLENLNRVFFLRNAGLTFSSKRQTLSEDDTPKIYVEGRNQRVTGPIMLFGAVAEGGRGSAAFGRMLENRAKKLDALNLASSKIVETGENGTTIALAIPLRPSNDDKDSSIADHVQDFAREIDATHPSAKDKIDYRPLAPSRELRGGGFITRAISRVAVFFVSIFYTLMNLLTEHGLSILIALNAANAIISDGAVGMPADIQDGYRQTLEDAIAARTEARADTDTTHASLVQRLPSWISGPLALIGVAALLLFALHGYGFLIPFAAGFAAWFYQNFIVGAYNYENELLPINPDIAAGDASGSTSSDGALTTGRPEEEALLLTTARNETRLADEKEEQPILQDTGTTSLLELADSENGGDIESLLPDISAGSVERVATTRYGVEKAFIDAGVDPTEELETVDYDVEAQIAHRQQVTRILSGLIAQLLDNAREGDSEDSLSAGLSQIDDSAYASERRILGARLAGALINDTGLWFGHVGPEDLQKLLDGDRERALVVQDFIQILSRSLPGIPASRLRPAAERLYEIVAALYAELAKQVQSRVSDLAEQDQAQIAERRLEASTRTGEADRDTNNNTTPQPQILNDFESAAPEVTGDPLSRSALAVFLAGLTFNRFIGQPLAGLQDEIAEEVASVSNQNLIRVQGAALDITDKVAAKIDAKEDVNAVIAYILDADFDIDVFEAVKESLAPLFEASSLTQAQQEALVKQLTVKLTERLRILIVGSVILGEQVAQVPTGEAYQISDELRDFLLKADHVEINQLFKVWYQGRFNQAPARPLLRGSLTPSKKGLVLSTDLTANEGEEGWAQTQKAFKALVKDGEVGLAYQIGTKQGRLARTLMKLFGTPNYNVSTIGVKNGLLRSSRLRITLRDDPAYLLGQGIRVQRSKDKENRIIETNQQLVRELGLDLMAAVSLILINADAEYLLYQFPEGENRGSIAIQERAAVNVILQFMDALLSTRDVALAAQRAA